MGGNGTEREEEEREKELITALMLYFIIVSWARLLTLTASTWLSTQRPPSPSYSHATVDCLTISLSLSLSHRNSSSITCLLKGLAKRHIKVVDPWRWFKWPQKERGFGLTLAVVHQICMQGKVLYVFFHACLFDTGPLRGILYFCKGPHVVCWPCAMFAHSLRDTCVCVCLLIYLFVHVLGS